ncbi:Dps family protein [Namhaeicola litoreus]|uniref:Dps family protein n=1 Tax=Namhaeicola litoreus TaxID=1052145 RepID=A0ABW3Y2X8_9FLAO
MKNTILGLDKKEVSKLAEELNILLANFQIYYQNLRGLHWNIKGKSFFELHVKFEELYTDAHEKIDMIAERILTLEGKPMHTFEDYIKHAEVPVGKNVSQDKEAVQLVLDSLAILLEIERKIMISSAEADDEGTNSLISDFISEQEKTSWMLKAWLS